ncbi:UNVERIFIED_CONTAM: hypothetical protein K2H54_055157 [Gekko kuhli]
MIPRQSWWQVLSSLVQMMSFIRLAVMASRKGQGKSKGKGPAPKVPKKVAEPPPLVPSLSEDEDEVREQQIILDKLAALQQAKASVVPTHTGNVVRSGHHKESRAERKRFREEVLKQLFVIASKSGDDGKNSAVAELVLSGASGADDSTAIMMAGAEQPGPSGKDDRDT